MEQPSATVASTPLLLWPRAIERPADAGWTLVAGLDGRSPARVDGGGLVAPNGADWVLDWWVGADDRWYLPAREPAVRQHRAGPGPVIVTSMRVPSGDVVATAYPVVAGGRAATAIEIENASPAPVALAVALRPVGLDGTPARPHRLELVDGTTVTVDGEPAVLLPRSPNEAMADGAADVFGPVTAGEPLTWDGPVSGSTANAACLFPLPHTTSLRFVVLDGADGSDGPARSAGPAGEVARLRPDAVPDPEAVTRGWATVVDRAGGFRLPDPGLTDLLGSARARLVLAAPGLADGIEALDPRAASMVEALALTGHGDECRPSVERLIERFPARLPVEPVAGRSPALAGAESLRALVAAAVLLGSEPAEELLASAAQLLWLVERTGEPTATAIAAAALARLATAAGQPEAADHLRRGPLAGAAPGGSDGPDGLDGELASTLDDVTELAAAAGPTGAWPPGDRAGDAARFALAARSLLVRADRLPGDDGRTTVRLLPAMPTAWLGGEVEVHRAPAGAARVSFAIRWHGYRPALLWQVDPADGESSAAGAGGEPIEPIRLTCPGLDPDWSSDERSGETLLAGSATALPDAPAPGDSFS